MGSDPIALALLGFGGVIVVTVELTFPDSRAGQADHRDEGARIGREHRDPTEFLTAGFIAWTEDDKDSSLADHVKATFQDKYTRPNSPKPGAHVFRPESAGELWVFSETYGGAQGWGRKARGLRAVGIAHELETGNSDPSPS